MPGKRHLPTATAKENRMYEHIRDRYIAQGFDTATAKSIAAATVNKKRGSRRHRRRHTG